METLTEETKSQPVLQMKTYRDECMAAAQIGQPPGIRDGGRVTARRANIIEVDFTISPPAPAMTLVETAKRRRRCNAWWDAALLLLLLTSLAACLLSILQS